jgi:hypothetical protein
MSHLRRDRRRDRVTPQDLPTDFLGLVRVKATMLRNPNTRLQRLMELFKFLSDLESAYNAHCPEADALARDIEEAFAECTRADVFIRAMDMHPELFEMDRSFLAEDAFSGLPEWEKIKILRKRLRDHLETLEPG